jgi:hypothetical protein
MARTRPFGDKGYAQQIYMPIAWREHLLLIAAEKQCTVPDVLRDVIARYLRHRQRLSPRNDPPSQAT